MDLLALLAGIVMIVMSKNRKKTDADQKGKRNKVLLTLGIILVVLGSVPFVISFSTSFAKSFSQSFSQSYNAARQKNTQKIAQ